MSLIIETILKYWVGYLCGIIAALFAMLYRKILMLKKAEEEREQKRENEHKAMCEAIVAMMRDRIFQACRYHLKNGTVSTSELEVLNSMYQSYHALGGDTIATTLVERVNKLKIMIEDIH